MNAANATATLTVSEVRGILRISVNSAYNLIHSKSFPVRRVGNTYRIPAVPFYQWIGVQHPELAEDLASKSQLP
ncbi:MAG: helix-turn-helix domain-containing protein [Oscillospiraceae bacterium]|nr:helix-turn-helix domain-containing protein [Oscillospiraceae bacterium]